MSRFYALVLFVLTLPISVRADKFDLGIRGEMEMLLPATWEATSKSSGDEGFRISIKPKGGANVELQITALFVKIDQSLTPEEMQRRFGEGMLQMVPASVEKKADMQKLTLKDCAGFYAPHR